jgi:hypothetical protein
LLEKKLPVEILSIKEVFLGSPEITVGNKVSTTIFSLEILFLKVIARGTNFIARTSTESLFSRQLIPNKLCSL